MSLPRSFVPATEADAIDEIDFSGIDTAQLNPLRHEISRTIRHHTGIPISLGIAPTKTLAKITPKPCKQYPRLDGCCDMHSPQDIEKVLRHFPVGDVWGMGRRHAQMLEPARIRTAWEFTPQPTRMRKRMSITSLRMCQELHRHVAQYVAACAAKLRAQHSLCGEVRVFLLTNRFRENMP